MVSGSLYGKAVSLAVFSFLCFGCSVVLGNYQAASYPQQNYYAVPAAHYQPQYQQPAATEDHRVVDEKDYDVGGFSYWYLGMPLIMIPLLLLLCTPFFHKPYDVHGHGWEPQNHGYGYGYGTYDLHHRMGMEETSKEEDVTERVLKATSNSNPKRSSKKTAQAQG